MEGIPKPERSIRSEEEVTALINDAVTEVFQTFKDEMTERDKELLIGVVTEIATTPHGRLTHLMEVRNFTGASPQMTQYINQILVTLRQTFTKEEQEKFKAWSKDGNLLDEIN